MEKLNLDIHTAVQTALVIAVLFVAYSLWYGIRSIRKARSLKFFRMRRDRMVAGWRMIFIALGLSLVALGLNRFAEPMIYNFFPPTPTLTATPTITLTPTMSLTPSITLTPTITKTPSVTDTPTASSTPHVPLAVEAQFLSTITPNPNAVFSPLVFSKALDENFQPIEPAKVFQNPVGHLYAQFSYDGLIKGVQWTALWYYGTELVNFETKPWDGGTGGIGYTDWNPEPQLWLPGEYEVQIFVGLAWKISGRFTVEGQPPTPLPSATPSLTATPTPTSTSTRTPTATRTPTPTRTNTATPGPSPTRQPTATPAPSATRQPTGTLSATPNLTLRFPSLTPSLANTHAPTYTASIPTRTSTHAPTYTASIPPPPATHQPTNTPTR